MCDNNTINLHSSLFSRNQSHSSLVVCYDNNKSVGNNCNIKEGLIPTLHIGNPVQRCV